MQFSRFNSKGPLRQIPKKKINGQELKQLERHKFEQLEPRSVKAFTYTADIKKKFDFLISTSNIKKV